MSAEGEVAVGIPAAPGLQRMNVHDPGEWIPFPEFSGDRASLHESPDGRIVAATYRFKGRHTWTLPYDDIFYVIAGTAVVTIEGHPPVEVAAGDFCRVSKGSVATFDMSEDFHEISVLVADEAFELTDGT